MRSFLVSLSGGMDSAVLLRICCSLSKDTEAVSFHYGSKHNQYELEAARKIAEFYGIMHHVVPINQAFSLIKSNLMLTGEEIPEGHYQDDTMRLTVVPGRNMIFGSILAGIAKSRNIDTIALAVHQGDHAIYPDCRPDFWAFFRSAIHLATERGVYLPFLHKTKKDILQIGLKQNVPLYHTRTCYKNQLQACGKCGACQERLEAFQELGAEDPISYDSRTILPKDITHESQYGNGY